MSNSRDEAQKLSELATSAAETVDLRHAERIRATYDRFTWTQPLAAERFTALTSLRLLAMLQGDLTQAFVAARDAAVLAPRPALAAIGETNAAAASRLLGDAAGERIQLERAWDALPAARKSGGEEVRIALATFAIEGAQLMSAEARKAVTLGRLLAPKGLPAKASPALRKAAAYEAMAAGRAADASGKGDAAIEAYEEALELWRALGYDLRAALIAMDLRRLTGDESYARIVRPVLARAPKAWFAKQFRSGAGPVDRLSRAERVVLAYLINGDSAKAIGAKLKRSPYTISNHTRKIFQAFGLNSRGKVIARCAELGITSAKLEREAH